MGSARSCCPGASSLSKRPLVPYSLFASSNPLFHLLIPPLGAGVLMDAAESRRRHPSASAPFFPPVRATLGLGLLDPCRGNMQSHTSQVYFTLQPTLALLFTTVERSMISITDSVL